AYMLLDPDLPPERKRYMVATANARLVVSRPGSAPADVELIEVDAADGGTAATYRPGAVAHPDDLAYVVFTSGSTGEPKAVAVTGRSLVNHARAVAERYGLAAGDRVLQFASPGFDVVGEEVFPTLLAGGQVVPLPDTAVSAGEFEGFLRRNRVTVANLPTAGWAQW